MARWENQSMRRKIARRLLEGIAVLGALRVTVAAGPAKA